MGLGEAIRNKSLTEVEAAIEAAVKVYKADKPADIQVETAFGDVPASAVFDEDTKWVVITSAYVGILNAAKLIPAGLDKEAEIAKLIATDAALRNIVAPATSTGGLL